AAVAVERARRRELAELVADELLGDEHRHELAAVVHHERDADHVRRDRRAPRVARLDDALARVRLFLRRRDLLREGLVDERAFLDGTRHVGFLLLAAADDELLGPLVVAGLEALRLLAPRRARVASTGAAAFAAAHRVIDGVHRDAAVVRAHPAPPHASR